MEALGLDIATLTGFARARIIDGEWVPVAWGLIDCSPRRKGEPEGVRYRRFADALPGVIEGADHIAIERSFGKPGMNRTAEILSGLRAVAMVEIDRVGIPYVFVPPAKWKSFMVPRPKMPKGQGLGPVRKSEARERLNGWGGMIDPSMKLDENESDALGVLKWRVGQPDLHRAAMATLPDLEF